MSREVLSSLKKEGSIEFQYAGQEKDRDGHQYAMRVACSGILVKL